MDFLRMNQLDIMLVLTGILTLLLFFSIAVSNLSAKSRPSFILIIASTTMLLLADRYAYIYRGDPSELGFWMVRICNFLTFFATISVVFFYNALLKGMVGVVSGQKKAPTFLRIVDICCIIQVVLIIVSQFTGLIYTFDEMNQYQRAPLSVVSFVLPLVCMVLQLVVIYRYRDRFGKRIRGVIYMFDIVPFLAGVAQLFVYGLSLVNISIAVMAIILYIIVLNDMNLRTAKIDSMEMDHLREQQKRMGRLLDQTTTTLIAALDAKEEYTHGHSARVAKYARAIAEYAGKDEKECDEIYYAGLLHDIGKIGIPDEIINKNGRLTPEEYEIMKQHPVLGRQILSGITEMPYLAIGANFHHERYDGKGYPEGLVGKEIPELGRILAVADAYDAMSSNRSYRNAIPQQKIREEFIKNSGTQFDPEFAQIMQHLIDLDSEYQMKEKNASVALSDDTEMVHDEYRGQTAEGILITDEITMIRLKCVPEDGSGMPSFILFDSLDGIAYTDEKLQKDLNYFEYGELRFDGETRGSGVRKAETAKGRYTLSEESSTDDIDKENIVRYEVLAVRYRDHALFEIKSVDDSIRVTIALPDSSRFLYAGITGENCSIRDVSIDRTGKKADDHFIPRIAEEISYIDGPTGEVPNVQIDGYRTDATEGMPLRDGMELHFHTMSLPTARLVWHTAFIDIFYSDNRKVDGPNHTEFALIRLDGEYWDDSHGLSENDMEIVKKEEFTNWDDWLAHNKEGMDCTVRFLRRDNKIVTITENNGISIRNTTTVKMDTDEIYVCLSGDQVALTNIRTSFRPRNT